MQKYNLFIMHILNNFAKKMANYNKQTHFSSILAFLLQAIFLAQVYYFLILNSLAYLILLSKSIWSLIAVIFILALFNAFIIISFRTIYCLFQLPCCIYLLVSLSFAYQNLDTQSTNYQFFSSLNYFFQIRMQFHIVIFWKWINFYLELLISINEQLSITIKLFLFSLLTLYLDICNYLVEYIFSIFPYLRFYSKMKVFSFFHQYLNGHQFTQVQKSIDQIWKKNPNIYNFLNQRSMDIFNYSFTKNIMCCQYQKMQNRKSRFQNFTQLQIENKQYFGKKLYNYKFNNKIMRQDLRQRERQIRKLHESIQKYQQSPNTKKAVQQATLELANAIQYKFRKSQVNRNYVFPRNQNISDDQFDLQSEIVDLKVATDFLSHQLSIAQQPQSNLVYISEKTVLLQQRFSPFSKQRPEIKSKPKIKVFKKKNFQTCQTISKLDRLKTEHIQANFSTISYKNEQNSKSHKNQSSASKSRTQLNLQSTNIRKKLKIASRIQHQHLHSPVYANITIKTQYTHSNCGKRKQGKQNQRVPLHPYQQDKCFASQNSTKKIQSNNKNNSTMNIQNIFKPYINVKVTHRKNNNKQNQFNDTSALPTHKKNRSNCKSFQNLKSIRLGSNRSTEKIKVMKGLYA